MRPPPGESNGSPSTLPPASTARAPVSSALSTATCVVQTAAGGGGAPPCVDTIAATSRPPRVHTK